MSLFQHILVPVDFTEKNRTAIRVAEQLARQNHSSVTLLHVVETIDKLDDDEFKRFYSKLVERSNLKLNELAKTMDPAIDLTQTTLLGKPATEIVRYEVQQNVDLLVMNSHNVQPNGGRGWGTLSYRISILCQCPILLVK